VAQLGSQLPSYLARYWRR